MQVNLNFHSLYQLVLRHVPQPVQNSVADEDMNICRFEFKDIELRVEEQQYELIVAVIDRHNNLNRRVIDPLRKAVRDSLSNCAIDHTCDYEVASKILCALEIIAEFELSRTESSTKKKCLTAQWRVDEVNDWNVVLNNPHGLDVTSVQDIAFKYLQKTPQQIVQDLPRYLRVLHIEPVLRDDLAARFSRFQATLHERLSNDESVLDLAGKLPPHGLLEKRAKSTLSYGEVYDDLVTPRVTYHGTYEKSVGSIVRHGFKLPGKLINGKIVASPRSGVVYNRGIYSSQAPFYALSFSKGERRRTPIGDLRSMRLFVCATIMGRTLRGHFIGGEVHGPLVEGYDSHFYAQYEYITHHEAAILPCYVIHLDLGSEEAKKALAEAQQNPEQFEARQNRQMKDYPRLKQASLAPGDAKREQDRRKAAAMKWFPEGFGTAKGTDFKIQDIGEVEDDEEDYGYWQNDKHAFVRDDGNIGDYLTSPESGEKISFMDQYQHARSLYKASEQSAPQPVNDIQIPQWFQH